MREFQSWKTYDFARIFTEQTFVQIHSEWLRAE